MNNTAILTAGNAIYSAKRAKKKGRIEEIKFDPEARRFYLPLAVSYSRDYLTGFRKRKTQRLQKAAEYAKEQARKERIEARKEVNFELFKSLMKDTRGSKGRFRRTTESSE